VKILPLTPADLDLVKALQPPDWGPILPMHEYYLTHNFCHSIKLRDGDTDVGIGTAIIHPDTAWLAHIIVDPTHRNKGIGGVITKELMAIAGRWNATVQLLATDLGEPVYRKLGFEEDAVYTFYKDGTMPGSSTSNPFLIPFTEAHRSQIFALDRDASGEDRSLRLSEHLTRGTVFMKNGSVDGFFLPTLGEGLIVASTDEAGIALMELRMDQVKIAVVPFENENARTFLAKHQFNEFRKAKRMYYGIRRPWKPRMIYNRVSGQIG
jgi:GNAT superfamily N-acetyltransferase